MGLGAVCRLVYLSVYILACGRFVSILLHMLVQFVSQNLGYFMGSFSLFCVVITDIKWIYYGGEKSL